MKIVDEYELRHIAVIFRKAIEDYISLGEPKKHFLQNFPKGCCTLVSGFLQRFLFEKLISIY